MVEKQVEQLIGFGVERGYYRPGINLTISAKFCSGGFDRIARLVVLNKGGSFATSTPIALPATGLDRQVVIGIETMLHAEDDALQRVVLEGLAADVADQGAHQNRQNQRNFSAH